MLKIDPAGWPFVAVGVLLASVGWLLGWVPLLAVGLVLTAFMLFFFRDPDRRVPSDPAAVLAPADGRVTAAGAAETPVEPAGQWLQVSIFLSPLDVHVNRIPWSGRVTHLERRRGRFLAAYRPEAAAENERTEIWLERGARRIVVRQVVGVLARRIVCRLEQGRDVHSGDRYGVMKFGSRMDVFLPEDARLLVRVGDRVRAGETVIARLD